LSSKGFETYSISMIQWLQKFLTKGWLSDISKEDYPIYLQAQQQDLVVKSTSAPYRLTKKGQRVINQYRKNSDPDDS
jgi:hypothetical protein